MPRLERATKSCPLTVAILDTPAGAFTARFSQQGLAELNVPGTGRAQAQGVPNPRWVALTRTALLALLSGRAPRKFPPLDVSVGTAFQRRVWSALRKIPAGETRSYGELAATIHSPSAARAVGGACGANPIPLLIPCHRVLAGGGRLGGFSCGLEWKRRLLEVEGVSAKPLL